MITAESSGIAMCFDPSNGSRSNIVISSCYGINTGITTTRTDCDHFTINFSGKKASRISRIYEKKNRVIPDQLSGSGTIPGPVPYSMRSKSSLSSEQVMALATITRATTIKTGKPQILDWAFSKGTFYILQARTVNSLENIPDTTAKRQVWQLPASSLLQLSVYLHLLILL
jgi:pyruvate,water dikinase